MLPYEVLGRLCYGGWTIHLSIHIHNTTTPCWSRGADRPGGTIFVFFWDSCFMGRAEKDGSSAQLGVSNC